MTDIGRPPGMERIRWRGTIAYDGTGYQGWQRQGAGRPSIQGTLEAALAQITDSPVRTYGASRTDAGVHAFGQVCHVDSDVRRDPELWLKQLNAVLPKAIRVVDWAEADPRFHARHDALGKTYVYDWSWGPPPFPLHSGLRPFQSKVALDRDALLEALARIRQQRDWTSFTSESTPPLRSLSGVWLITGPGRARMVIQGPGFHFQQVRRIAHAVAGVAGGTLSRRDFDALLDAPRWNAQEQPAVPYGLILVAVHYDTVALGQLPALAHVGWWREPRETEVRAL